MKQFGKKFRIMNAIDKGDFRLLAHLLNTQKHSPEKPIDKLGDNIFHYACSIGSVPMVQHIYDTYHLDIHSYNTDGMNSLHLAACSGSLEVIEWL